MVASQRPPFWLLAGYLEVGSLHVSRVAGWLWVHFVAGWCQEGAWKRGIFVLQLEELEEHVERQADFGKSGFGSSSLVRSCRSRQNVTSRSIY